MVFDATQIFKKIYKLNVILTNQIISSFSHARDVKKP